MVFPQPVFSPTRAATAYTFINSSVSSSDLTTYTFSGVSFGTAFATRYIAVSVSGSGSNDVGVSSVTIGGVAATLKAASLNGSAGAEIWLALVPTGTTGDIVVTWAAAKARCGIGWGTVSNLISTTPVDTGTSQVSPLTDTINIASGGIVIAVAVNLNNTVTYTWTGLTENFDQALETVVTHSGASAAFSSTQTGHTVTATLSGGSASPSMAVVSLR